MLRVWEHRYGFPEPVRNEKGERVYPEIQLRRPQRIRRLLDRGIRPGKLLPLSEDALDGLEARLQPAGPEQLDETVREILERITRPPALTMAGMMPMLRWARLRSATYATRGRRPHKTQDQKARLCCR